MKKSALTLMSIIAICVYMIFLCNSILKSETTPSQTETLTPSEGTWAATSGDDFIITYPSLATGNCVDRAVTVLNLLQRRSTLENIYAAVSKNHVQIARKIDGKYEFLELVSFSVRDSNPDFKWGEDLVFYKPGLFLAAANKIKPEMTLPQLKQFASEYKE